MPDMSKPGAHLADLLSTLEFMQAENVQKSNKHSTIAEIYQECAHRLRRAIEAEAEKTAGSPLSDETLDRGGKPE